MGGWGVLFGSWWVSGEVFYDVFVEYLVIFWFIYKYSNRIVGYKSNVEKYNKSSWWGGMLGVGVGREERGGESWEDLNSEELVVSGVVGRVFG